MRDLALVGFRLRAVLRARVLLAPLVGLVAVQLIGLAGPAGPAAIQVVTASSFALPLLGWAARQVLDDEPDEQVRLSTLAVGGQVRAEVAGLLTAYALVAPLGLLAAGASLLHVDQAGVPARDAVAGLALAMATALAAVAIGACAARAVAGTGGASVVVLVAAPVLVAVVGLSSNGAVTALVPRLDEAVRAANAGRFAHAAPALELQVVLWSSLVLALRHLSPARLVRRRT